jgi:hypothetical protein
MVMDKHGNYRVPGKLPKIVQNFSHRNMGNMNNMDLSRLKDPRFSNSNMTGSKRIDTNNSSNAVNNSSIKTIRIIKPVR